MLSKWFVLKEGSLMHQGRNKAPKRIIYLDDHSLYRKAVINNCIIPFFKDPAIIEFQDGDTAYSFIKQEIKDNNLPDLVITDINHPGMNGNKFAQSIRFLEKLYQSKKEIPILVISMVDETCSTLLSENIVNAYLCKSSEAEEIVECLEEILYR